MAVTVSSALYWTISSVPITRGRGKKGNTK